MDFKGFVENIKKRVQEILEDEITVSITSVNKLNIGNMTGLLFTKNASKVSPTIYMEELFNDFSRTEDLEFYADLVISKYRESLNNFKMPDVEFIKDWGKAKPHIRIMMVDTARNAEVLMDMPHRNLLNLSVCYVAIQANEENHYKVAVKDRIADMWGVTEEELYHIAMENIRKYDKPYIANMEEILEDVLKEDGDHEIQDVSLEEMKTKNNDLIMMVFTNTTKNLGASGILFRDVLDEFGKKISSDFYILPSSVHELIIVPQNSKVSVEELQSMVAEINESCVIEEEVLNSTIYYYNCKEERLEIAPEKE